jgi:hypothetical protein
MENEIESKKEVEDTTVAPDSSEKKIEQPIVDDTTQNTEDADDTVVLSKKEVETLKKKADDFEKMTQTKRGQKLLDKMKSESVDEEPAEVTPAFDYEEFQAETIRKAEEAALKIIGSKNQEDLKSNLTSAYDKWIVENPWANDDEIFNGIFKNIQPTNSNKEEDLLSELDRAALLAHPRLYTQNMESRLRSKILVEQEKINVGSGGSSPSVRKDEIDIPISKEDQLIIDKYFDGNKDRFLKTRKINN